MANKGALLHGVEVCKNVKHLNLGLILWWANSLPGGANDGGLYGSQDDNNGIKQIRSSP